MLRLNQIKYEDFVNYKKPSMTLAFPYCSFKCNKDCGRIVCQNFELQNDEIKEYDADNVIEKYLNNDITSAIVMQGLEPFDSFEDVYSFIHTLRNKYKCMDDIVIYTGYYSTEILQQIIELQLFANIIIKFGRYIPNQQKHYDDVLGVYLASDNQYAVKIS